jgi:TatD DNase family protein
LRHAHAGDTNSKGLKDLLIDTHAHLDMEQFEGEVPDIIDRAGKAGVGLIITIGTDAKSSESAADIADGYEGVYFSPGVHPHDVKDIAEGDYDTLSSLATRPKAVAIGETGLDYYYDNSPRELQREHFRRHIRLAIDVGRPLIVHSRDANAETMEILAGESARDAGGTLHCFSGDYDMARRALDMGLYISVGGSLTFKKADALRDIIKKVPIERILLETDCPYLAPHPLRGKRNEPAYVRYVAETLAGVKGLSVEDVERITSFNASNLFGLPMPSAGPVIAYPIRDSLYLNVTNRCTNDCSFCVRNSTDFVKGHNLRLMHEPAVDEILDAMKGFERYREVVFCGYGEPFLRLDAILEVSRKVKEKGVRVRVNTNGHALLIHGEEVLPKIRGLVDALSVSLNFPTGEEYADVCKPRAGIAAYGSLKEFVKKAREFVPEVTVTVLAMPGVDLEACRAVAKDELGVPLRVREYNEVG